ncbi:MAG: DUF2491 family protein [Deltaproteobacteria bacterium]|nr:DUF2491 family protein [Deltaproteobacteria bacterium]
MGSTWSIFKKIGQKKVDDYRESFGKSFSDRIDRDLPLGLRFNCLVEVPEVDFILAGADLLTKYPGTGCSVVSYGKFPVGDSMLHRFYLDSSAGPYMLQVVADSKKVIEECKLFMPYDEIYPEDWGFWLAEQDGYIGLNVFDTKNSVRFFRVWENPEATRIVESDGAGTQIDRIPPVRFVETLYIDPFGEKTETLNYESMLYGRNVSENVDEYLMISAVDESDGASVQIMVGVELAAPSIKVI